MISDTTETMILVLTGVHRVSRRVCLPTFSFVDDPPEVVPVSGVAVAGVEFVVSVEVLVDVVVLVAVVAEVVPVVCIISP